MVMSFLSVSRGMEIRIFMPFPLLAIANAVVAARLEDAKFNGAAEDILDDGKGGHPYLFTGVQRYGWPPFPSSKHQSGSFQRRRVYLLFVVVRFG